MDKRISPYVRPGLNISVASIVAGMLGFDLDELINSRVSRKRNLVETRFIVMAMERQFSSKSLNEIGFIFRKDHATVLHAVRTVNNLRKYKEFHDRIHPVEIHLKALKQAELI